MFDLNWFDCRTQSVDWFRLGSIEFPNVRLTMPGTYRLSERTVLRSHLNRFIVFDVLFFSSRVLLRFISLTSPWWDQFWTTTKREWETRETERLDKHCKHVLFRVSPPIYLNAQHAAPYLCRSARKWCHCIWTTICVRQWETNLWFREESPIVVTPKQEVCWPTESDSFPEIPGHWDFLPPPLPP